jgi:signal transduction histidine kinase
MRERPSFSERGNNIALRGSAAAHGAGAGRRFSDALVAARTSDDVLRVALSEATRRAGAIGASIFLIAGDEMWLELAGSVGYAREMTDPFARISVEAPLPIAQAFVTTQAVFLDSPEDLRRRYPAIGPTPLTGASFACLPLSVEGRRLGVMTFSFGCQKRCTREERELLVGAARESALALERVLLYESAKRSAHRADTALQDLAILFQVTDALNRSTSLDGALSVALDGICRVLQVTRSSILLFDNAGVMRFVAWKGLSEAYRRAVDGHSPWSPGAKEPDPIYVEDVETDPAMRPYLQAFAREEIRALAFVPLVSSGTLLGKFMIYARERRTFTERERSIAASVATQLAFVIDRHRARERADSTQTALIANLERTVAFCDRFVGILGHDLQNPLAAIRMSAHTASATLSTKGSAARAMDVILTSAERMARMIDQLLDFTRARIGNGIDLSPRPCDIVEMCEVVAAELQAARASAKVTVDATGATVGQWDPDRIAQLLSNVVGNAIKHGSAEWTAVYVDGTKPAHVAIEVRNRGEIPAELLPILFDPTRRARPADPAAGLGLGLYIADQIVRAHGGSIDVTSAGGETTALIVLPRHAAAGRRVFEGDLPPRKAPARAEKKRRRPPPLGIRPDPAAPSEKVAFGDGPRIKATPYASTKGGDLR